MAGRRETGNLPDLYSRWRIAISLHSLVDVLSSRAFRTSRRRCRLLRRNAAWRLSGLRFDDGEVRTLRPAKFTLPLFFATHLHFCTGTCTKQQVCPNCERTSPKRGISRVDEFPPLERGNCTALVQVKRVRMLCIYIFFFSISHLLFCLYKLKLMGLTASNDVTTKLLSNERNYTENQLYAVLA